MKHVINAKELRASLPEIVRRVRQGDQYTVLYRSRPAFRIVGMEPEEETRCPLPEDPLYAAEPVGVTSDGWSAADHDSVLYKSRGNR